MDIEEAADGGRNATLCDNLGRWDGVGGGREVGEGGDICISMADPCCCMTETNTILQSNYPLIKKKKKRNGVTKAPASCTAKFRFCPRGNGNHCNI